MGQQLSTHPVSACHAAGQGHAEDTALVIALVFILHIFREAILPLARAFLAQQVSEEKAPYPVPTQEPASDEDVGEVIVTQCHCHNNLLLAYGCSMR
jgi:hypothetical protein